LRADAAAPACVGVAAAAASKLLGADGWRALEAVAEHTRGRPARDRGREARRHRRQRASVRGGALIDGLDTPFGTVSGGARTCAVNPLWAPTRCRRSWRRRAPRGEVLGSADLNPGAADVGIWRCATTAPSERTDRPLRRLLRRAGPFGRLVVYGIASRGQEATRAS
jgi:hypothetical protein